MKSWSQVWNEKALSIPIEVIAGRQIQESEHLQVNGFNHDSESVVSRNALDEYVSRISELIKTSSTEYLYEFGCGTGYFTNELAKKMEIRNFGGSDQSAAMIRIANSQFPEQTFQVADAASFRCSQEKAAIICNSVFQYFPSLQYTDSVLENVLDHNPETFAFLDVVRSSVSGNLVIREGKNNSSLLSHISFNEEYFTKFFTGSGYEILITNQEIEGYKQSNQRFNVFGKRVNPMKGLT